MTKKDKEDASTSASWLVQKARECLAQGETFAAKTWLLTAKTLFPSNFGIQYEAFQMEQRAGKVAECGEMFYEMISTFPREELLWSELRKIVSSQEGLTKASENESNFLKEMFDSLSLPKQRELLLQYADHLPDVIEKCKISLFVLKKFHGAAKEQGVKLMNTLAKTERTESPDSPLNIYRKTMVCDVLPLLLKSSEVHLNTPAITKHKSSILYLSESQLLKWLELSMEFYIHCHLSHHLPGYSAESAEVPDVNSLFEAEGGMSHSPWQMLHDQLLLFANKLKWDPVLKLKDKIDPMKSRSIKSQWKVLHNSKENKSIGIFYCILKLYFSTVIEYCSAMLTSHGHKSDHREASEPVPLVLLERIEDLCHKDAVQQSVIRTPKKKKRLDDGTAAASDYQLSSEDVTVTLSPGLIGQINESVAECLQVASDCHNYLRYHPILAREFDRILDSWKIDQWQWLDIFTVDCVLHQAKYSDAVSILDVQRPRQEEHDSPQFFVKKQLQLASCFFCLGDHKRACLEAIRAVEIAASEMENADDGEGPDRWQGYEEHAPSEGRHFIIMPCLPYETMIYCVQMFIAFLKMKLTESDGRDDRVISQLLVLIQFNWPQHEDLFNQLIQTVLANGALNLVQYFKYITNVDILEEFAYLNSCENVSLEILAPSSTSGHSRRTVTRGVNKENKEDFRLAMDRQVQRSRESTYSVIQEFFVKEDLLVTVS